MIYKIFLSVRKGIGLFTLMPMLLVTMAATTANSQIWTQTFPSSYSTGYASSILRWNTDTLFISGSNEMFMMSIDGGEQWKTLPIYTGYNYLSIASTRHSVFLTADPTAVTAQEFLDSTEIPLVRYSVPSDSMVVLHPHIFIPSTTGSKLFVILDTGDSALVMVQYSKETNASVLVFSSDDGLNWEPVRLADSLGQDIPYVDFHDRENGLLVFDRIGKAYTTTDGGLTWVPIEGFLPSVRYGNMPPAMASQWVDDTTIVVFNGSYIPLISRDKGMHWTEGAPVPIAVTGCSFSESGVGYVVGKKLDVFKTTDWAEHWTRIRDGLVPPSLEPDGNGCLFDENRYFVVSRHGGCYFRTTDGGTTWDDIQYPTWSYASYLHFFDAVNGLAMVRENSSNDMVWIRTTDGGKSFVEAFDERAIGDAFPNFVDGSVILAVRNSTPDNDTVIYRSGDRGVTWDAVLRLKSGDTLSLDGNAFVNSDFCPSLIVVITNEGFLISTDLGASWKRTARPLSTPDLRFIGTLGKIGTTPRGVIWIQRKDVVLRSTDMSAHWDTVLTLHGSARAGSNFATAFFFGDTAYVYAHYFYSQGDTSREFVFEKTTDGGLHWSEYAADLLTADATLASNGSGIGMRISASEGMLSKTVFYHTDDYWHSSVIIERLYDIDATFGCEIGENEKWAKASSMFALFSTTNGGINWVRSPIYSPPIALVQSYPNPVAHGGTTTIPFVVSRRESSASINLYDVLGRKTASIAAGSFTPGRHALTWSTAGVVPGVYFVRMTTGEGSQVGKIVVQ